MHALSAGGTECEHRTKLPPCGARCVYRIRLRLGYVTPIPYRDGVRRLIDCCVGTSSSAHSVACPLASPQGDGYNANIEFTFAAFEHAVDGVPGATNGVGIGARPIFGGD